MLLGMDKPSERGRGWARRGVLVAVALGALGVCLVSPVFGSALTAVATAVLALHALSS